MSGDDASWVPDLSATLTLPLWVVGVGVTLIVVVVVLAAFRAVATHGFGAAGRYGLIVLGVIAGFMAVARLGQQERGAERRALDARAMELTARAVAPGSVLACLDAGAGETVAASCEKAVFASPETVASGIAYVGAQLALLSDGLDYAARHDAAYEYALGVLQRAVEADRFGFVAQVLAVRDGCTAERCDFLAFLRDASRVRANLREQAFQRFVGRNAAAWSGDGSPAATGQGEQTPQGAPVAGLRPQSAPSSTNLDFPSAASIPPVSIMNAEPPLPASPPPPAAASGEQPAPPPRRALPAPRRPPASQQQGSAPPVQLTPQPAPPAPAAAQAPPPASAPPAGEANFGSPARVQ